MIKIFISDKDHIRKNNLHNQDGQEFQHLMILSEMTKPDGPFLPEAYLLYLLLPGITYVTAYTYFVYLGLFTKWHEETITQSNCAMRVICNALYGINVNLVFEQGLHGWIQDISTLPNFSIT